jgi:CRISPR/Cas system endoribonuclease Cas6 (RAMP superfamily)
MDWSKLHEQAWQLRLVHESLQPYRWDRGSQRARGRIPVLGFLGEMVFEGDLVSIMPLLQIGEMMNVGSHASLGLGRYILLLLP